MAIAVTCAACQATFRVKDEYAGKCGKCPHCQAGVEVPSPPAPDETSGVPVRRPAAVDEQHLVLREILQAFQGDIPPVRRTGIYRVGTVLVAIAMLVLPALYVALVVAIGGLLYVHAISNFTTITQMRSWFGLLFLYVGPLIIGVILLFFMVKPIFARRSRAQTLRVLSFGEEPLLFALVTRVAQVVGAPEPKRIAVDSQVNASAGFGSLLGIAVGGDLVLTVGLPLVAGLTIQEFAGVIAHELGHFTQGTAMRLNFIIRTVNGWLTRVVYERDDWDEGLARGCETGDQLILFLFMARLCVWLTRRVLWVLMAIGHALGAFMSRQMEYDADRYQTRLAGTDAFAETMRQIQRLDLTTNTAYSLVFTSWIGRGTVPDDLSALITTLSDGVSPKDYRRIEKKLAKVKTGLFDTHPALGERLANAQRENAAGVFHLDGPATQLFKNFRKMSRAVTLDFYHAAIARRMPRDALVPVAAFLGNEEALGGIRAVLGLR